MPTHGRVDTDGYAQLMAVKNDTSPRHSSKSNLGDVNFNELNFTERNFLELLSIGAPQAEWLVKRLAHGQISHAEAYREMQRLSESLTGPRYH